MIHGLLLAVLAASVEFEAVSSDGATVRGSLREFTPAQVVLETTAGEKTLPTSQLTRLARPGVLPVSNEPLGCWLNLVDGGRLLGRSYATVGGVAKVVQAENVTLDMPTSAIRAVRLKPMSPELTAAWDRIAEADVKGDCVVIREENSLDFLEGVLGDVGGESFAFTLNGEALTVKRIKADGLVYFHAKREPAATLLCTVSDVSGSKLNVAELSAADGTIRLTTVGGIALSLPVERVAEIEFPARYLADFKPESIKFTPRIASSSAVAATVAEFYRPRFNQGPTGGSLRLGERDYAHGLSLRSRTEITFLLPSAFSKFTALAGIDDRWRPSGNVRLTISGDDRVLFDEVLTGRDAPKPLSLDVSGVVRLKFLVDYGDDRSETGDHFDLCEPRLYP